MEEQLEKNGITEQTLEDVLHSSMIPYSEYVILDRALPRVEDGLKPVQRRILYAMHDLGLTPDKPYKKSARIVGETLGKYHPHGDTSVYYAMVRLAQPFNMGSVLVDGQGNFGSIDGDGAAAMRYTEARLNPLALELLRDLDKNTVKWSCNFDDTTVEPDYLPGRFPNLLVNGASGIAVGLATNIPPHNLTESIDGVIEYIRHPSITLPEMMKIIKGPDFPGGGYIIKNELDQAYQTGKGKITLRAKIHIENEGEKKLIVIDELPYQVNKSALLENILKIREEKKGIFSGISEILDETDRNGMRAVIKVKKDVDVNELIEALFKVTNLQTSYGINMVAIADGKPQLMGLLDIIAYYVDYQRDVILRRTRFELDQAKERANILEGLVIAVQNIDEVVRIIKNSASTTEARDNLKKAFSLNERQAQAILDLRLARLTHLEVYKLEQELKELKELIARLTAIVGSKKLQMQLIADELEQIKRDYRQPRRSKIINDLKDYTVEIPEEEKPPEDSIIAVNVFGDLKRMSLKHYSMATKEFTDASTKNEISPIAVKVLSNQKAYCFTNLGNCYKVELADVEEAKWRGRGEKISAVIPEILVGEKLIAVFSVGEKLPTGRLLFYTRDGMVKKSDWSELGIVKSSFAAVKLKEGDEVICIESELKDCSLMFVTALGMCLNADMSDIPVQGRIAAGVKGIQLSEGDSCIMIRQVCRDGQITLITDKGLGKRIAVKDIDVMARYRKGVKIIDLTKSGKDSKLLFAHYVPKDSKDFKYVLEADGELIPVLLSEIKEENRTQGGKPLVKGKITLERVYAYNSLLVNG